MLLHLRVPGLTEFLGPTILARSSARLFSPFGRPGRRAGNLLRAGPRRRRLRADRLAQLLRAGGVVVQERLQAAALLLRQLARLRHEAALVELPGGLQFRQGVKEALEAFLLCVLLLDRAGLRRGVLDAVAHRAAATERTVV